MVLRVHRVDLESTKVQMVLLRAQHVLVGSTRIKSACQMKHFARSVRRVIPRPLQRAANYQTVRVMLVTRDLMAVYVWLAQQASSKCHLVLLPARCVTVGSIPPWLLPRTVLHACIALRAPLP